MITHKYRARRTETDGINFQSKKEARYYEDLKIMQKNGDIIFFLRQVPFHLPGNIKYVCEFQIFCANGEVSFVDVKGVKTSLYITKKKLVESLYPIKIEEII